MPLPDSSSSGSDGVASSPGAPEPTFRRLDLFQPKPDYYWQRDDEATIAAHRAAALAVIRGEAQPTWSLHAAGGLLLASDWPHQCRFAGNTYKGKGSGKAAVDTQHQKSHSHSGMNNAVSDPDADNTVSGYGISINALRGPFDHLAFHFLQARLVIEASIAGRYLARGKRRKAMREVARLLEGVNRYGFWIDAQVAGALVAVAQALLETTQAENARVAAKQRPKVRAKAYNGRDELRQEAVRRYQAGEERSRIAADLNVRAAVPQSTVYRWILISMPKPPKQPIHAGEKMPSPSPTVAERLTSVEERLERQKHELAELARQVGITFDDAAVTDAVERFLEDLD